jgi:hypothetical protein
MKSLLSIFSSLLLTASIQAGIINVPADQPTIQAGINAAVDGDTVLVADSTYTENINYLGKAITVASHYLMDGDTAHISNTIIDGSQPSNPDSGSVVTFESGEDTTSVLTGFTITGGSGTITEYTYYGVVYPVRAGGGILCRNSGARISANVIMNNNVPTFTETTGGGVSVFADSSGAHTRIDGNKIISNVINGVVFAWGSGVDLNGNGTITNNNISSNTSFATNEAFGPVGCWSDTASRTVLIKDNQITENVVNGNYAETGGIQIDIGMSASIIGNTISDNQLNGTTFGEGGGIRLLWKIGSDTIDGNIISGNVVNGNSAYAGGIMIRDNENTSNTVITNNIISGNQAKNGAGIRCLGSKAQIINNTIVNNTASIIGGGMRVEGSLSNATVMNTILWGNSAPSSPQISMTSGLGAVSHSDVEGGWPGEGNIDADPFFADSLFNLSDSSACIGAGIDSIEINGVWYHAPPFDFDGDPRPNPPGSMPDIGAQESPLGTPVAIEPLPVLLPSAYALQQNYPNPFNPGTTIEFALAKPGWVTLKIYNILGEEVAEFVSENLSAGSYKYNWSRPAGMASGVYYYRLEAGEFSQTKKMLLIR